LDGGNAAPIGPSELIADSARNNSLTDRMRRSLLSVWLFLALIASGPLVGLGAPSLGSAEGDPVAVFHGLKVYAGESPRVEATGRIADGQGDLLEFLAVEGYLSLQFQWVHSIIMQSLMMNCAIHCTFDSVSTIVMGTYDWLMSLIPLQPQVSYLSWVHLSFQLADYSFS
jgi:hypothetical protein